MSRKPVSLTEAVEEINEAYFWKRTMPATRRRELASFLIQRQGQPGAYRGMFAPVDALELAGGYRLFTGEVTTNASARHILGEEAGRALRLLKVDTKETRRVLQKACKEVTEALGPVGAIGKRGPYGNAPYQGGTYCCCKCSVGLWRLMVVGGYDAQVQRLEVGLRHLKEYRQPDGQWRTYPFWYTASSLAEMIETFDLQEAKAEARHSAPRLEKALARKPADNPFAQRRQEIARRLLAVA